ncbi:hypothetical protein OKW21_001919 [Catalinimonas alkaloidigena]|uniref:hypothetical protein n=1 Tax=Catalinimonas alkaloidigena TaxID=1075417 RepID=UPI0024067FE6|nr:hypothetical protein [Catalinimonas alkaloidigena]MDF9796656.1 hypothetical protein [Catalinimonas alkaloidigena]
MPDCSIIKYKTISIVYTDVANCSGDTAIPYFEEVQQIASTFDDKSMFSLVNAKETRFNSRLLSVIKETVKKNNPKVKATAVYGLSQLSILMVNSIISITGRKMMLFDSLADAKEWLYEEHLRTS